MAIHAACQGEHSIALLAAFEDADGVYLVQVRLAGASALPARQTCLHLWSAARQWRAGAPP